MSPMIPMQSQSELALIKCIRILLRKCIAICLTGRFSIWPHESSQLYGSDFKEKFITFHDSAKLLPSTSLPRKLSLTDFLFQNHPT